LLKDKKRKILYKKSKLEAVCEQSQMAHRCIKPFTSKTIGMIEKANDIMNNKTLKITKYTRLEMLNQDLRNFLLHYNLYSRHGSLRKELKA